LGSRQRHGGRPYRGLQDTAPEQHASQAQKASADFGPRRWPPRAAGPRRRFRRCRRGQVQLVREDLRLKHRRLLEAGQRSFIRSSLPSGSLLSRRTPACRTLDTEDWARVARGARGLRPQHRDDHPGLMQLPSSARPSIIRRRVPGGPGKDPGLPSTVRKLWSPSQRAPREVA
jgi:hypothetical protein